MCLDRARNATNLTSAINLEKFDPTTRSMFNTGQKNIINRRLKDLSNFVWHCLVLTEAGAFRWKYYCQILLKKIMRWGLWTVWQDLSKFFGNFQSVYLVFGKMLYILWYIFMLLGKFSYLWMAKHWANNLPIWSHWF